MSYGVLFFEVTGSERSRFGSPDYQSGAGVGSSFSSCFDTDRFLGGIGGIGISLIRPLVAIGTNGIGSIGMGMGGGTLCPSLGRGGTLLGHGGTLCPSLGRGGTLLGHGVPAFNLSRI
jgi:hypothetical protein